MAFSDDPFTSSFQAQLRRLTKRRGLKRATLAVAHAQLCTANAMLKETVCRTPT